MKNLLTVLSLFFTASLFSHFEVSGDVVDELGDPIAFASVILQNSQDLNEIYGAITSEEGAFFISDVPKGNYTLKASLLGFSTYESSLIVEEDSTPQRIVLSESTTALDEVVVQGNKQRGNGSAEELSRIGDNNKF